MPEINAKGFPGKRLDWYLAGIKANIFIYILTWISLGKKVSRKGGKLAKKNNAKIFK